MSQSVSNTSFTIPGLTDAPTIQIININNVKYKCFKEEEEDQDRNGGFSSDSAGPRPASSASYDYINTNRLSDNLNSNVYTSNNMTDASFETDQIYDIIKRARSTNPSLNLNEGISIVSYNNYDRPGTSQDLYRPTSSARSVIGSDNLNVSSTSVYDNDQISSIINKAKIANPDLKIPDNFNVVTYNIDTQEEECPEARKERLRNEESMK